MASSSRALRDGEESDRINEQVDLEHVLVSEKEVKGKELTVDEEAIEWEDEGEGDEEARVELGVVGKVWTQRHINAKAFMATMKSVWQPMQGMDISNIGRNTFVFQFYHWRDKQRVMEGQPWHFDNHAISLDDIAGKGNPANIELFKLPLWVRVYNLPFKGRLNHTNLESVGEKNWRIY